MNCVDCSFIHINTYLTSIQENPSELSKEIEVILRDFSSILMYKFGISFKHVNIHSIFDISIEKIEKIDDKKFKYNLKHPIQISFIFSLIGRFLGLNLGQINKSTTCYYYGFLLEVHCLLESLQEGNEEFNELLFHYKNFNEISSINSPELFPNLSEFFEFLTFSNQISFKNQLNEQYKIIIQKISSKGSNEDIVNNLSKYLIK